jgi:hypothetical protein
MQINLSLNLSKMDSNQHYLNSSGSTYPIYVSFLILFPLLMILWYQSWLFIPKTDISFFSAFFSHLFSHLFTHFSAFSHNLIPPKTLQILNHAVKTPPIWFYFMGKELLNEFNTPLCRDFKTQNASLFVIFNAPKHNFFVLICFFVFTSENNNFHKNFAKLFDLANITHLKFSKSSLALYSSRFNPIIPGCFMFWIYSFFVNFLWIFYFALIIIPLW